MDAERARSLHQLLRWYLIGASLVQTLAGIWMLLANGPVGYAAFGFIHCAAGLCSLASAGRSVANQTLVTGISAMLAAAAIITILILQNGGSLIMAYGFGGPFLFAVCTAILLGPAMLPLIFATMGLGLLVETAQ